MAIERNEERQDKFILRIGQYSAEQLVFIDESAVDRRTPARRYGYANRRRRAEMYNHFVRGERYTLHSFSTIKQYFMGYY
jgi:hypothetical protein